MSIFHPEQLDTDQWVRAAKAMEVKIAILTATHEIGFDLYQLDVHLGSYGLLNLRERFTKELAEQK